ncbi:MAG: hypothetical protein QM538_05140 [Methylacidiphilales bacterium]|nr:hypothetical protein [Candidatus Methylacidiphilales bacterium]
MQKIDSSNAIPNSLKDTPVGQSRSILDVVDSYYAYLLSDMRIVNRNAQNNPIIVKITCNVLLGNECLRDKAESNHVYRNPWSSNPTNDYFQIQADSILGYVCNTAPVSRPYPILYPLYKIDQRCH